MHKVNDKNRGRKRGLFNMQCADIFRPRSVEKYSDNSYQKTVSKSSNLQTTLSRSYEFATQNNGDGKDHMVKKSMKIDSIQTTSGASTSSFDTVDKAITIPFPIDYPEFKVTKVLHKIPTKLTENLSNWIKEKIEEKKHKNFNLVSHILNIIIFF
jgi:hypothetical protein